MKMNILVVDDESVLREMLRMYLEKSGHSVIEAENASDANNRLQKEKFDLIITDNDMPQQNQGLAVIEKARSLPSPPRIIWASGRVLSNPETADKAQQLGADRVVCKSDLLELLLKEGIIA